MKAADAPTASTRNEKDIPWTQGVAALSLRDLVIVDTPDMLLIAHEDSAQQVKKVVDILKARKHENLPAE